jgi:hypothetical protein
MGAAAEANAKRFYSILNQSYVYVKPDPKNAVQIVQKNTFLIPKSPNSQFFMKFQQVKTWGFDSRYNTFVEFSADGGQTWTTKFMDLSLMFMGEEICIEYHINYKSILAAFQKIDPNMTLEKLLKHHLIIVIIMCQKLPQKRRISQNTPAFCEAYCGCVCQKFELPSPTC